MLDTTVLDGLSTDPWATHHIKGFAFVDLATHFIVNPPIQSGPLIDYLFIASITLPKNLVVALLTILSGADSVWCTSGIFY